MSARGKDKVTAATAGTPIPATLDPADSWEGLEDAAERRKRQNRVHQRAARHRKALEKLAARPAPGQVFIFEHPEQSRPKQPLLLLPGATNPPAAPIQPSSSSTAPPAPVSTTTPILIPPVIPYTTGPNQRVVFTFPLPRDHQLLALVQYNTLRATLSNFALLAPLSSLVPAECAGALQIPPDSLFPPPPAAPPPDLAPTALQRASPRREPWVDAVPDPVLRDNLLRSLADGVLDRDDLCADLVGGLFDGFDEVALRGMVVWSDPWRPEGWEISDGFAAKWGFLLKGCHRMVESTNRWRDLRGEDRLVIEV